MADSLADLQHRLQDFAADRDWGRFHSPKNLAVALAGETGELLAELQWLTEDEIAAALDSGSDLRGRLATECADVLLYLIRLADITGIDLIAAADRKIAANAARYTVEEFSGTASKAPHPTPAPAPISTT